MSSGLNTELLQYDLINIYSANECLNPVPPAVFPAGPSQLCRKDEHLFLKVSSPRLEPSSRFKLSHLGSQGFSPKTCPHLNTHTHTHETPKKMPSCPFSRPQSRRVYMSNVTITSHVKYTQALTINLYQSFNVRRPTDPAIPLLGISPLDNSGPRQMDKAIYCCLVHKSHRLETTQRPIRRRWLNNGWYSSRRYHSTIT